MAEITSKVKINDEVLKSYTFGYNLHHTYSLFHETPLGKMSIEEFLQKFYKELKADTNPEALGIPLSRAELETIIKKALIPIHPNLGKIADNFPTPGRVLDRMLQVEGEAERDKVRKEQLYESQTGQVLKILEQSGMVWSVRFSQSHAGEWSTYISSHFSGPRGGDLDEQNRSKTKASEAPVALYPDEKKAYETLVIMYPDETVKSFNARAVQFSNFLLKELKAAPDKKKANQEIFWKNMEPYISSKTLEEINGVQMAKFNGIRVTEFKEAAKEGPGWDVDL